MEHVRKMRHKRVRKKVVGTSQKPRLSVFRSSKNIFAQIIDDSTGTTLVALSTLSSECKAAGVKASTADAAFAVGEMLAKKAQEKGISVISFDRGGYLYHGRVKSLAEGARKGGLKF